MAVIISHFFSYCICIVRAQSLFGVYLHVYHFLHMVVYLTFALVVVDRRMGTCMVRVVQREGGLAFGEVKLHVCFRGQIES